MNRLLPARQERSTEERANGSTATDTGGSWKKALRKAVLGIGVLGIAYVASRRLQGGDWSRTATGPDRQRRDAGPHDVRPGEGRQSFSDAADEAQSETNVEERPEVDEENLPGEERSREEIEERAVDDAHEEPAPPGEMAVDEDVVEDVVEEGDEPGDEGDEPGDEDESETGDGQALE